MSGGGLGGEPRSAGAEMSRAEPKCTREEQKCAVGASGRGRGLREEVL